MHYILGLVRLCIYNRGYQLPVAIQSPHFQNATLLPGIRYLLSGNITTPSHATPVKYDTIHASQPQTRLL
jgi:hypothetical protein